MSGQFLDIILFAVVAIFLIMRLKNILGSEKGKIINIKTAKRNRTIRNIRIINNNRHNNIRNINTSSRGIGVGVNCNNTKGNTNSNINRNTTTINGHGKNTTGNRRGMHIMCNINNSCPAKTYHSQ